MKNKYLIALAACFSLSGNAFADEAYLLANKGVYLLAQKHLCTSCHSIDKEKVGPPWVCVSIRYHDLRNAEAYLTAKIRSGGTGTWYDDRQMPASDPGNVPDADIKQLAHFILGLPPIKTGKDCPKHT